MKGDNMLLKLGEWFELEVRPSRSFYVRIGAFERSYNTSGLPSH